MPEQKQPMDRKIIGLYVKIAIVGVLGFLFYALLCHGVSSRQIQRLVNLRAKVEAMHQKAPAAVPLHVTTPTSASLARAAAQARCDRLCQDLFGPFKIESRNNPVNHERALKLLPNARELVAFYDQRIGLSDQARIGLCKQDTVLLTSFLASSLMKDSGYMTVYINGQLRAVARPDSKDDLTPDQVVNALIPAAQFLRVMDMPSDRDPVADAFQFMFDPDPRNANAKSSPIASALQTLDLNLISPQEPWMWQNQIPYHAQIAATGANDLAQRLSTFQGTYDYIVSEGSTNGLKNYFDTLTYLPFRQRDVEYRLEAAEFLASNRDKITAYQDLFTPGRSNHGGGNIGMNSQGQARARLACAAIEMLRGNPAPSEAGPASNFYDIYTGGRVQIEKTAIQNGNVRVKLLTNCSDPGKNYAWGVTEFSFVVPANHPCLNEMK